MIHVSRSSHGDARSTRSQPNAGAQYVTLGRRPERASACVSRRPARRPSSSSTGSHPGRVRWKTLGRVGEVALEKARRHAKDDIGIVARGGDPLSGQGRGARRRSPSRPWRERFLDGLRHAAQEALDAPAVPPRDRLAHHAAARRDADRRREPRRTPCKLHDRLRATPDPRESRARRAVEAAGVEHDEGTVSAGRPEPLPRHREISRSDAASGISTPPSTPGSARRCARRRSHRRPRTAIELLLLTGAGRRRSRRCNGRMSTWPAPRCTCPTARPARRRFTCRRRP